MKIGFDSQYKQEQEQEWHGSGVGAERHKRGAALKHTGIGGERDRSELANKQERQISESGK